MCYRICNGKVCVKGNLIISETLLHHTSNCFVGFVQSENLALASMTVEVLGHIGLYRPLPSITAQNYSAL